MSGLALSETAIRHRKYKGYTSSSRRSLCTMHNLAPIYLRPLKPMHCTGDPQPAPPTLYSSIGIRSGNVWDEFKPYPVVNSTSRVTGQKCCLQSAY